MNNPCKDCTANCTKEEKKNCCEYCKYTNEEQYCEFCEAKSSF